MKYCSLLALPMLTLITALLILYLAPSSGSSNHLIYDWQLYLSLLTLFAIAIAFQLIIVKNNLDKFLFPMILLLAMLGLAEIARLKPDLFLKQTLWLDISLLFAMVVIKLWDKIKQLINYPYILGIACVIALGLPMIFGVDIAGSKNWLVLGPMSIQPSEFGKILILFFLAAYLSDHRQELMLASKKFFFIKFAPVRFIAPLICIWGMALLMFVIERDLGSALLFFSIAVIMTYIATGKKNYVFLALCFIIIAGMFSYMFFGHVRLRFAIWLNPWSDPTGAAYQIVQSLFAIASGGVWGTGLGFGHPDLIPEVHTDFVFAALAEELGLIGAVLVIVLYILIFWRGILIALGCYTEKEMLLAAGAAFLLILQMFIIVAGVTKFLPLTGITLPFISYGGSSLLASFALLAILLSLSKRKSHD